MRQRHSDALSAALGLNLHPDHLPALDVAVNNPYMNWRLHIISKEGDRAGKEFMIQ
jgi:hypothetical protein